MKFLFASDSFKGSLSSEEIIKLLTKSAYYHFPGCETIGIPIADGGEGTVSSILNATKGQLKKVMVHGPLMEQVEAEYGVIHDTDAIIEMAKASGLTLIEENRRDPRYTTSFGTGELIKDALDSGYRNISIAIGGSATNDGGMGAMRALGVRFLDINGIELSGIGADLIHVKEIDIQGIHPAIKDAHITVMCDVNNPLTGIRGATYTFGKQKGGTLAVLDELELGMINYANTIKKQFGIDVDNIPGAGAAGGLGSALSFYLSGKLKSGIDTVLDLIQFDEQLQECDLVITGEGRVDWQSAYGKVLSGVGKRCKSKEVPAIAIVGTIGDGAHDMYELGINSIISTVNGIMSLEEAMERAEELYENAADRLFRLIKTCMDIR